MRKSLSRCRGAIHAAKAATAAGLLLRLAPAFLAACTTQEPLPAVDRSVPESYRAAAQAPGLPRPGSEWWREFSSPELNRLEEAGLANNRDLRAAIARVAQADAQARLAEASLAPSVEIFARREAEAPRVGVGLAETRERWDQLNRYRLGVRANYEVDLWGKGEFAAQSALALALASVHQRESVALTLTADLAAAYLEHLSLADRLRVAERGLRSRREQLRATMQRAARGDATAQEVAQARVALATAESAHGALEQRRERAFNRLALLAGTSPAALRIEADGLSGVAVPAVDPGLPSDLLCRRPDVRRAEAQLAAAELDVHAVRAALLPSFPLLGEIGLGARHLASLTNPASLFFLATASLAQTVFDGGRKESQVEAARARHLELLHQYSGTLLTALREVEDALAGVRLTGEQHAALAEAAAGARSNYELVRRSFDAGAADLFALLDAEQKLVAAEDSRDAALHDRLRAAVDLYRALGGGMRTPAAGPCAP
jgi:NodT family efflux transporter outer membrane factor (OMF) lipoprotein